MKLILALVIFMAGSTTMLFAQKGTYTLLVDGKAVAAKKSIVKKMDDSASTDIIRLKKTALKKAKTCTLVFENYNKGIWKRVTWLENENVTDPSTYAYNLPSPNGTIAIPASVLRTALKGKTYVEIWTSLKPANDRMLVRESRELVCKIMID